MNKIIRFLGIFIKKNPVRSFLIFLFPFILSLSIKDPVEITSQNVIVSFKENGKYTYVYRDGSNYSTRSFDKEQKLVDNKISYDSIKVVPAIGISFCVVIFLVVLFTAIIDDNDGNWHTYDCWVKALMKDIKCESENGILHYVYKGRTIHTHDSARGVADEYDIRHALRSYISNGPNLFPIFESSKVPKKNI